MWLWFPSGGCVPIGIAGVTGAIAALVHADTLGRRRAALLAAAGCVLAVACDNSLVALLPAPFFVSIVGTPARGRPAPRRPAGGLLRGPRGARAPRDAPRVHAPDGRRPPHRARRGPQAVRVPRVRGSVPLRLPRPERRAPARDRGVVPEDGIGVRRRRRPRGGGRARRLSLTPSARRAVAVALATLPAGLGFLALVGIARWNYPYEELFDADRYFFPLLIPAALLGGAAAASVRERFSGNRRLLGALLLSRSPVSASRRSSTAGRCSPGSRGTSTRRTRGASTPSRGSPRCSPTRPAPFRRTRLRSRCPTRPSSSRRSTTGGSRRASSSRSRTGGRRPASSSRARRSGPATPRF